MIHTAAAAGTLSQSNVHFGVILAGVALVAAGVWRVGGGIYKLAAKVDLLAWRVKELEDANDRRHRS